MATNDGPLVSAIEFPSEYVNAFGTTIGLSGSTTLTVPSPPFVLEPGSLIPPMSIEDAVNVSYDPYVPLSVTTQPFVMRFGEQEWTDPGTGFTWTWEFNVDCRVTDVSPGVVDGRPFLRLVVVRYTGSGWAEIAFTSATDLFLPTGAAPNTTYTVGPPYTGNPEISVQSSQRAYFLSELAAGRVGLLCIPDDLVNPDGKEPPFDPWATTATALINNWAWANSGAFVFDPPEPVGVYKIRKIDGTWYTLGSGSRAKIRALDGAWYVENVTGAQAKVRLAAGSMGPGVDFGKE